MTQPSKRFRPWSYAVVSCNGNVVLTKKTRWPFIGTFDLPWGGIEHGEAHSESIVRELEEEIWLVTEPVNLRLLGIFHHVVDYVNHWIDISQHIIAIVHRLEVDEKTFEEIASWKSVGTEIDSDAGERIVVDSNSYELVPLTPVCKKALDEAFWK